MNLKYLALSASLLPLATHAQLGVHEHGYGQLNLAQNGEQLLLELLAPAVNIVGFEHNPATSEEQAAFDNTINKGLDAAALFTLPVAAGCDLTQADHVDADDSHHDDHHHHDDEPGHQDITLHYSWRCSQPEALDHLDASGLFKAFPSFHRLEFQGLLGSGQAATTLTPANTRVSW